MDKKEIRKQFPLGCEVRPLKALKRGNSVWLREFSNKAYSVIAHDEMLGDKNGEDAVLVLKTGPEEWEYQIVYPDEVSPIVRKKGGEACHKKQKNQTR